MSDLSITAANVIAGADAVIEHGTAAVAVNAGQQTYLDGSTGKLGLADNNSGTPAVRKPRGTALHSAAANQPLAIQRDGSITIGASLTAGVVYYLSDTPGGICPVADLATGEYPSIVGIATSTSVLDLNYQESGVAL